MSRIASVQETIDSYLASCKRSKSSSSVDEDGDDENCDEEDEQSQKDFNEFKAWLDGATPASSQQAPSTVPRVATGICKICGNAEPDCQ